MKKINRIFSLLFPTTISMVCTPLLVACNNKPQEDVYHEKTIEAKYIGGQVGSFTFKWANDDRENCTIVSVSTDFEAKDINFTFNPYAAASENDTSGTFKYEKLWYRITKIGNNAFTNCIGLTGALNLPNCIQSIGESAFEGCTNLTSMPIMYKLTGYKLESIGNLAFKNCGFDGSISLFKNIKTIGDYAFAECNNLRQLIIPNNVKNIGKEAFANCVNLQTINFLDVYKDNDELICHPDFIKGCEKIKSLYLNESLYKYWKNNEEWKEYTNIITEVLEADASLIGGWEGSFFFSVLNDKNECKIVGCSQNFKSQLLDFNSQGTFSLNGKTYTITTIGQAAFQNNYDIEFVVCMPKSIQTIEPYAFANCKNLYNNIRTSAKTIGDHAFYGCERLTFLDLWEGIETIGDYAFANCALYKRITFPNSVKKIGDHAFAKNQYLEEVEFGTNIEEIGYKAFELNPALKTYNLVKSNSNNVIKYNDMFGDSIVYNFIVPFDMIAKYQQDESWQDQIQCIKHEMDISNSVIGGNRGTCTFQYDGERCVLTRTKYLFSANNWNMNNGSFTYQNKTINITTIGTNAFDENQNLTGDLTIPNTVEIINDSAFAKCDGLNGTVTIPDSVKIMSALAFVDCTNVQCFDLSQHTSGVLTFNGGMITKSANLKVIYVPKGQLNEWQTANGWNEFADIMQEK